METDDVKNQLHEIERSEAAGWLDFPPTPWWVPLYFGTYAAIATFTIGALDGLTQSLLMLALISSAGAMVWWQRRTRGTWPTKNSPRELNRPLWGLIIGALALSAVCVAVNALVNLGAAVALAGVLATALSWCYERAYARAAATARARLA